MQRESKEERQNRVIDKDNVFFYRSKLLALVFLWIFNFYENKIKRTNKLENNLLFFVTLIIIIFSLFLFFVDYF